MRKTLATGLTVASLMGVALALAAPTAATTVDDNDDGTVTVSGIGGPSENVRMCASTVSAADCGVASFADDLLYVIQVNGTYSEGSTVFTSTGDGPLAAGTYTMVPFDGVAELALLNVVIGSGVEDQSSSLAIVSRPRSVILSFHTVNDSSCRPSSASGFAGSWMNLPGADDCTIPATKPGATLLGWATNPNFPVGIAQRQVSQGWGAYEMFNDGARLTAVFIPVGGATLLSGDGNLFAIWSE